jgi:hypothetical protein
MSTQTKVELHIETMIQEARKRCPGYEGPFKVQILHNGQVIQSTTSDALVNDAPWILDTEKLREAAKSGECWLVILKPVVSCHLDFSYLKGEQSAEGENLCQ